MNDLIDWLARDSVALVTVCGVVGLLFGSFFNVVIHRLPRMLEAEWRQEYAEFSGAASAPAEPFNLFRPRSQCPHCGHAISALENIPLLSWLVLRGRCRACSAPISARYPLVEGLAGGLAALLAWHFGFGFLTVGALVLTGFLLVLGFIDADTQYLPDSLTLPLLWIGLLFNLYGGFVPLADAVLGAAAGYLLLWSVYHLFRLATGKEGMGYGDFKLLAALGAWLGWQMLPLIILLSAVAGSVLGIALILLAGRDRAQPLPFGPYLALGGFVALLWGRTLTEWYLGT